MEKTIFEKIIDREIPAEIVYEDDRVLAFLDVKPVNHGHTLVIPKEKFVNIFDANSELLGYMMSVAGRIGTALRDNLPCDGVNIVMNNAAPAGQMVFHAHIHVIPRLSNDGINFHPEHKVYDAEVAKEIVAKLAGNIR